MAFAALSLEARADDAGVRSVPVTAAVLTRADLSRTPPRWTLEEPMASQQRHLFRRHVPRPRLSRLLDESAAQAIVLAAPAGYGKTVLAAEWALGRRHVEWYRATAASADLSAFVQSVAPVFDRVVPGAGFALAGA